MSRFDQNMAEEAGRCVLGVVMLNPACMGEVLAAGLEDGDFSQERHRRLFQVIRRVWDDKGTTDMLVVLDEMGSDVREMGGIGYVTSLPEGVPSTENVLYYVDIVRSAALRRRAISLVEAAMAEFAETGDIRDSIRRWEGHLGTLARDAVVAPLDDLAPLTLATCTANLLDRLYNRPHDGIALFPWPGTSPAHLDDRRRAIPPGSLNSRREGRGWESMSSIVDPLWPDRLVVLIGSTGRGKSGFALQIAEWNAWMKVPVLYVSAEMGTDELVARLLAQRAKGPSERDDPLGFGVSYTGILRGSANREEFTAAAQALNEDCPNLYLWAPGTRERTIRRLQDVARLVSKAHGGRPPLVVLDYVQRFVLPDAEKREGTSAISGALRDLARPGGLGADWPGAAVLALSSTARSNYLYFQSCEHLRVAYWGGMVDATGKPKPDGTPNQVFQAPIPLEGMGKETGELEYDAPLLICMTTDPAESEEPVPREGLVVVAKNRHGGCGAFKFRFQPACGRFTEVGRECRPSPTRDVAGQTLIHLVACP